MRDLCQCVVMEKANVEQAQAGSPTDLGLVLPSQGLTSSVTCFLVRKLQSLLCMVLIKIRESICKVPCLAHCKHLHKTCNEWLSAAKVSLGNLGQCQRLLRRYLFLEKALVAELRRYRQVYVRVHAAGGADKGHHATGAKKFQLQTATSWVSDRDCHCHMLQGLQPRHLQVHPADCRKSGWAAGKPAP